MGIENTNWEFNPAIWKQSQKFGHKPLLVMPSNLGVALPMGLIVLIIAGAVSLRKRGRVQLSGQVDIRVLKEGSPIRLGGRIRWFLGISPQHLDIEDKALFELDSSRKAAEDVLRTHQHPCK